MEKRDSALLSSLPRMEQATRARANAQNKGSFFLYILWTGATPILPVAKIFGSTPVSASYTSSKSFGAQGQVRFSFVLKELITESRSSSRVGTKLLSEHATGGNF